MSLERHHDLLDSDQIHVVHKVCGNVRTNTTLSVLLWILAIIILFHGLVSLVGGWQITEAESSVHNRFRISNFAFELIESLLNVQSWFLLTEVILMTGAIVFLIIWMYRAHRNTRVVTDHVNRLHHLWAIFSWFIPLFNLFGPYMVMLDICRASRNYMAEKLELNTIPLVNIWWWSGFVVFLISAILVLGLPTNLGYGGAIAMIGLIILIQLVPIALLLRLLWRLKAWEKSLQFLDTEK